jgi:hypothetical protein
MALGPAGLNLLSTQVLAYLDPAVSVTLAVLGVFAGLELNPRRRDEGILLAAASVEAGLTLVVVAGGMLLIHLRAPFSTVPVLLALMFGISAAVSSTAASESSDLEASFSMRIGDLDDVLPILVGAVAMACIHREWPGALWLAGQAGLIALVIAVAGWLLVAHTPAEGERHVFIIGTLLLLGGAAAYQSASVLFAGLVAGACWGFAGRPTRDSLDRDLRYLQHPLIVLLLLVAGARLQLSTWTLGLVVVYVLCRIVGKWTGGRIASWLVPRTLPLDLGWQLISPGVMAIAFALNVLQAGFQPDAADVLLAVAVLGSLGSEAVSVVAYPQRRAA